MQLIKIAVCDDEEQIKHTVECFLTEYSELRKIKTKTDFFLSGEALVSAWSDYDILFLDIDLPGLDGIETAEALMNSRKTDSCNIIMLSFLPERFQETYHIKARDFIIKPIEKKKFFSSLDYVLRERNPGNKFTVTIDGRSQDVYEKDINYIESDGNFCNIYTRFGIGRLYITINSIKDLLTKDTYYQCHRSYIVCLGKVKKTLGNDIQLISGDRIPLSRSKRKGFETALSDYVFNF